MRAEDLLAAMHDRLQEYNAGGRDDLILGPEVLSQARELWDAVQQAGSDPDPAAAIGREATARHLLGWLHYLRFESAPPRDLDFTEFVAALGYLVPLADLPIDDLEGLVPGPLRSMVPGAGADSGVQEATADALIEHGYLTRDVLSLQLAIALLSAVVGGAKSGPGGRIAPVARLSVAHRLRHELTSSAADLVLALEWADLALATLTPATGTAADRARAQAVAAVVTAYSARYRSGQDVADLERVIMLGDDSLASVPADDVHRGPILAALADAHISRFERAGRPADLERGIERYEQALAVARPGTAGVARLCTSLNEARARKPGRLRDR